jgi:uncharacterized protein (DUF58 family)
VRPAGTLLTPRGRLLLVLGAALYVVAWAFGSKPLYPVALGFLLVVLVAAVTVHLAARPMGYRRAAGSVEHIEGDDVVVDVELQPRGFLGVANVSVRERIAKIGERRIELRREGRLLRGRYVLRAVPRGRYGVDEAAAVIEDPFALERTTVPLPVQGALLVLPRIVELDVLFSESGPRSHDGRRLLLRRPSGFDVHSVREYEEGESLRKVHWKTTARRGQLMVKELQDEPRDEVAIVLDADGAAVAGGSFDAQVRAAGSLLRAQVWRDRRAVLVVNSLRQEFVRVQTYTGDWRQALETLAAVEPTGRIPLAALLADESGPAARAFELALVTARLEPSLVDRVVHRALAQRRVSVVFVDAPTFAGRPASREPGLLKLQASGVAVAVVRQGDDLAEVLRGVASPEAVHG